MWGKVSDMPVMRSKSEMQENRVPLLRVSRASDRVETVKVWSLFFASLPHTSVWFVGVALPSLLVLIWVADEQSASVLDVGCLHMVVANVS